MVEKALDQRQMTQLFLEREHGLLINGEWTKATSGESIDSLNPATGERIGALAAGGPSDIDRAVAAASAAFPAWSTTPGVKRAQLLWSLANLIEADAPFLGLLESLDNGMPARMAVGGAMGSAATLRYFAGWAGKIEGETVSLAVPDHQAFTVREPVGVVGAIVPWNFPLAMAVAKLAQILAAGCTVVLKPAELTSMSTIRLGELIVEAGFPAGVINIVTGRGDEAGQALADHPGVAKVSFTGSTAVGKRLLAAAAGNMKRLSLELGGKSPVIIFPDADLAPAAEAAAMGVFMNSGQICVAGSRVFVHDQVFDEVVERISARAAALRVGSGQDPDTDIGPLISAQHRDRVLGYIESGRGDGAQLVTGGTVPDLPGYFIAPAVFAECAPDSRIMREEIFGPVVNVVRFTHTDDVVERANDTEYGLSASIWTRDISTALKTARRIQVGTVRINGGSGLDSAMAFGGWKQSGWGRENGRHGVEEFTELKSISIRL